MGELIILIGSHIVMWILGLKIGLSFIAEDLYNMGKIGVIELEYMRSWQYLYDVIRSNSERND
jgi:hypothetical protein